MKLRNGKLLAFDDGNDERIPKGFASSMVRACNVFLLSRGIKPERSRIQFGAGVRRMGKAAAVVAVVAIVAATSGCDQDQMAHYAEFSTISNAESGVDRHAGNGLATKPERLGDWLTTKVPSRNQSALCANRRVAGYNCPSTYVERCIPRVETPSRKSGVTGRRDAHQFWTLQRPGMTSPPQGSSSLNDRYPSVRGLMLGAYRTSVKEATRAEAVLTRDQSGRVADTLSPDFTTPNPLIP